MHEVKTLVKDISCDCKCKFDSTAYNSSQEQNNEACQCDCKNYRTYKKDYGWNLTTCISENSRYLKSIADESVIVCGKIVNFTDSV